MQRLTNLLFRDTHCARKSALAERRFSRQPRGKEVADADDLACRALAGGKAKSRRAECGLIADIVDAAELVAGATHIAAAGCGTPDVEYLLAVVQIGLLTSVAIAESVGFDATA